MTVNHPAGLHARPAAAFVETARRFRAHVTAAHGGKHGNAKSILSVLSLGVTKGATVEIAAAGEDAEAAVAALVRLVETNFGEGG